MEQISPDALFDRIDSFTRFYRDTVMSVHRRQPVEGVSPLQFAILNELSGSSMLPVSTLADRMGISLPNCSRAVRTMLKAGLLEKVRDSHDRRILRLSVSRRGLALIRSALNRTRIQALEYIGQMTQEERVGVAEAMDRIESVFSRIHSR